MMFQKVPAFMAALAEKSSTASLALAFLILTATRTSETLGARWQEIDLENRVWTIPGERMKSRRPHRVPLSPAAIGILRKAQGKHEEWVFPGPSLLAPLSNMALLMQLRRMNEADVTTHGFRSSFRTGRPRRRPTRGRLRKWLWRTSSRMTPRPHTVAGTYSTSEEG